MLQSNNFFQIIFLNRPENGSLRVQKKVGHFSTGYLAICSGAETEPGSESELLIFGPAPHPCLLGEPDLGRGYSEMTPIENFEILALL